PPPARVAVVDHDDRVFRYVLRELAAHALRPDGNGVGGKLRAVFRMPLPADRARLLDPGFSLRRGPAVGVREHALEHDPGVAEHRRLEGVVAPQRLRIDVDLDGADPDLRARP